MNKALEPLQPIYFGIMPELKDKFVNNAVDTNSAADQFENCAFGILPDKVVTIEVGEPFMANASGHLSCPSNVSTDNSYMCTCNVNLYMEECGPTVVT